MNFKIYLRPSYKQWMTGEKEGKMGIQKSE